MLSEADARRTNPNLVVASLGAIKNDKPGGIVSSRVLFTGRTASRSTSIVASGTKNALQLKHVMREKPRQGKETIALTADVSEANRQIPIDPRDWHLLGCQVQAGGDVNVNTFGTFGVASASYYLLSAQPLNADRVLRPLRHRGGPSSLGSAGGDTVSWVDFEFLQRTRHLSQERRVVQPMDHRHRVRTYSEPHSARRRPRPCHVEHERPFPGLLFRSCPFTRGSGAVPPCVSSSTTWLLAKCRHYPCAVEVHSWSTAPRVDAQSSDSRTCLGGWHPIHHSQGRPDP